MSPPPPGSNRGRVAARRGVEETTSISGPAPYCNVTCDSLLLLLLFVMSAPFCHDACVPAAPRPMHETVETGPCASGRVNVRSVAWTSVAGSSFLLFVCVGASSTPRPNTDTAPSHMGGAQSRRASSRRRVLILRGALIPYAVATLSGRTCVRRKPMGRDKRCTVYPPSGLPGVQCRPGAAPRPFPPPAPPIPTSARAGSTRRSTWANAPREWSVR